MADSRQDFFGQSFHVDCYGVSVAKCDDLGFCYQLLDDLVSHLGMTKQSPPFIFRSPEEQFPDKAGLSGWVPLIESGISIHTLTLKGFVTLDIYTCGTFDERKTLMFLKDRLQPSDLETNRIIRGKAYYR